MSALVVLIAASLLLALGFLIAFIYATKKGQYEDVYTPSVRILFDTPLSNDDLRKSPDIFPLGGEKKAEVTTSEEEDVKTFQDNTINTTTLNSPLEKQKITTSCK